VKQDLDKQTSKTNDLIADVNRVSGILESQRSALEIILNDTYVNVVNLRDSVINNESKISGIISSNMTSIIEQSSIITDNLNQLASSLNQLINTTGVINEQNFLNDFMEHNQSLTMITQSNLNLISLISNDSIDMLNDSYTTYQGNLFTVKNQLSTNLSNEWANGYDNRSEDLLSLNNTLNNIINNTNTIKAEVNLINLGNYKATLVTPNFSEMGVDDDIEQNGTSSGTHYYQNGMMVVSIKSIVHMLCHIRFISTNGSGVYVFALKKSGITQRQYFVPYYDNSESTYIISEYLDMNIDDGLQLNLDDETYPLSRLFIVPRCKYMIYGVD
jgi:hypothetical protein